MGQIGVCEKSRWLKDHISMRRISRNIMRGRNWFDMERYPIGKGLNMFREESVCVKHFCTDYSFSWHHSKEGYNYWRDLMKSN